MRRLSLIWLALCAACHAPDEPVILPGLTGNYVATSCIGADGGSAHATPCVIWGISSQSTFIDSARLVLRPDYTADWRVAYRSVILSGTSYSRDSVTIAYVRVGQTIEFPTPLSYPVPKASINVADTTKLQWQFATSAGTSTFYFTKQ